VHRTLLPAPLQDAACTAPWFLHRDAGGLVARRRQYLSPSIARSNSGKEISSPAPAPKKESGAHHAQERGHRGLGNARSDLQGINFGLAEDVIIENDVVDQSFEVPARPGAVTPDDQTSHGGKRGDSVQGADRGAVEIAREPSVARICATIVIPGDKDIVPHGITTTVGGVAAGNIEDGLTWVCGHLHDVTARITQA